MLFRNRVLFHARARAYDASRKVEWVEATMYDDEATVDRYDRERADNRPPAATDLEFLDMVAKLNVRSVLDLGCGAGAFYEMLRDSHPNVSYFGYDLSAAQVARAVQKFGYRFAARDISAISSEEFGKYDAVHSNSVFSFMSPKKQITTLRRILRSGTKLLLETGCTMPDVRYVPRSWFRHYGQTAPDGRALMTAVSFPYRSEIKRAVWWSGHRVTFTERAISGTRAINGSEQDGSALADKSDIKRKHREFERRRPHNDRPLLLMARIAPREMDR